MKQPSSPGSGVACGPCRQLSHSSTYSSDTEKSLVQNSLAQAQKAPDGKNAWKLTEADTAQTGKVRAQPPPAGASTV